MTTTFGIEKENLSDLLREAHTGKAKLPDFQRGWVWDDTHVRSLLASVSLSFPIGTVMMLRTGSETIRFKERPIEGAEETAGQSAERLILDGQQRLTSLYQSLMLNRPVKTRDHRDKPMERWYYIDIRKALDPNVDREEAIVSLPADRQYRNFRREVTEDYSTPEREYEAMLFPLAKVFDPAGWRRKFTAFWNHEESKAVLWDTFEKEIVDAFKLYHLPVIELTNDTPKEAVCQVFEKVNTGGVTLTVFELLTATFAADDFDLRSDWEQRRRQFATHGVLSEFSNTDFLQAVTLIASWDRKQAALRAGTDEERAPAVGCKRADMLRLPLEDYRRWAPAVMDGLERAARFLHSQFLFESKFLPYGGQLVPLVAILAFLGKDWEIQSAREKLARWYWCGVFGELYGSTTETRFTRDLPEVLTWIYDDGPDPRTVVDATFAPTRLLSLRTRGSAAYKGIYALLLREGARDLRTGEPSTVQNYFSEHVDIHHIFPQKWCRDHGIDATRCDSIVNKTPLTSGTNRAIGGHAPSQYVSRLQNSAGISPNQLDEHLHSHFIDSEALRTDHFDEFFDARKEALLAAIERAMGKRIEREVADEPEELPAVDYELVSDSGVIQEDAA